MPGQIYLITAVTEGRQPLFADFALGRLVVQSLRHAHRNGRAATLAFVVMPDHFHWLMQLANHETLPRVIRSLKTHTSREINRRRNTSGALWQAGYHDHAVRQEENLREIARYLIGQSLARRNRIRCRRLSSVGRDVAVGATSCRRGAQGR